MADKKLTLKFEEYNKIQLQKRKNGNIKRNKK